MTIHGVNGAADVQVPAQTSAAGEGMSLGDDFSTSGVIAEVVANLDELRAGQRQATHALRNASHDATKRRIGEMRKAAQNRFVAAIVEASTEAGSAVAGIGAKQNSARAGLGTAFKDTGAGVGAAFKRRAALDDARAEAARDQAQTASEEASDSSSAAEQSQRRADQALGHMSEIQQQVNRGREAAIRG